jgi:hypothetical protein
MTPDADPRDGSHAIRIGGAALALVGTVRLDAENGSRRATWRRGRQRSPARFVAIVLSSPTPSIHNGSDSRKV